MRTTKLAASMAENYKPRIKLGTLLVAWPTPMPFLDGPPFQQQEQPAEFDQTHSLNLIFGYELDRWSFGSRFRYVTGNPITPVVASVYDADNDVYIPIRGPAFSQRVQDFYQLDVRVDKKWIYNRWILSTYLDIQNVTNNQNVESSSYSFDYSQQQDTMGLPILPSFGVKGEF